jgi:NAD(P)-dependent dehydrogenase (short-subunit alcohol dehydrogenase family)
MDKLNAVVTGGTRGIGLGIAKALLKRGASAATTFKNDEASVEAAQRELEGCLQNGAKVLLLGSFFNDEVDAYLVFRIGGKF